jgi:hypothetical protein
VVREAHQDVLEESVGSFPFSRTEELESCDSDIECFSQGLAHPPASLP